VGFQAPQGLIFALAYRVPTNIGKTCRTKCVSERWLVVEKAMTPIAEGIVDRKSREISGSLRYERLDRPANVTPLIVT